MRHHSRYLVAVILGTATALTPFAAQAAPRFCEGFKAKSSYSLKMANERMEPVENERDRDHRHEDSTLIYLQRLACDKPADAAAAMALRESWLKELGLSDADTADGQELMADVDRVPTDPARIENRSTATLTPVEQGVFLDQQVKSLDPDIRVAGAAWWLDSIPAGPSTVARLQFVETCIHELPRTSQPIQRAITWALCANDAHVLKRAELDKDLAASKATPLDRFKMHTRLGRALLAARAIDAGFAALASKEPGYKAILEDIPAGARTAWAATVSANAVIATSLEIQDAALSGSKKALAGCNDKLWPSWQAYVAKQTPETGLDMGRELLREPAANAMALALVVCNADDKTNGILALFLGDALTKAPRYRGERMAVLRALVENADKIEFDQKSLKLSPRDLPSLGGMAIAGVRSLSYKGIVRGTIAKVEPKDKAVLVTFKSEKVKYESCDSYKETNKIDRIEDGKIKYREVCTKSSVKTATETPTPVTVPELLATGLAAGLSGVFMRTELPDGSPGLPLELAQVKGKSHKVIAILGVTK